ncbi:MAG: winged helix-turn-helix domain-containing protein, partial [Anaerolineae bacterium]
MADYIHSGQAAVGSALPSTRDMQKQYGVSSGTILSAIAILEAQGVVQSRHGSGCYVSALAKGEEQTFQENTMRCFGLVCNSPSADISKRIHAGVDLMCHRNGYEVLLAVTDFKYDEEEAQVDRLV